MASVGDLKIRELTTQLAKERGLKGYSLKKNKSELVRLSELQENPLDQPVPDINVPVLTPQPLSRVQRFMEYAADKMQIFKKLCKLQME